MLYTRLEQHVSEERVHLVICPNSASGPEFVEQIASVMGQTAYDVNLRLRSGLPKPHGTYHSTAEAESIAYRLNELGIVTVVYRESDLPPEAPFEVVRLVHAARKFQFTNEVGQTLVLRDDEIAHIVCGRCVHTAAEATVGSGSSLGPVDRSSIPREASRSPRALFVTLFQERPRTQAIEFQQDRLNYSCLGAKRVSHSLQNLQTLAAGLHHMLPQVPMDRRLHNGHTAGSGEAFYNRRRVLDSTAAHATLIHWAMLAGQDETRNLTV